MLKNIAIGIIDDLAAAGCHDIVLSRVHTGDNFTVSVCDVLLSTELLHKIFAIAKRHEFDDYTTEVCVQDGKLQLYSMPKIHSAANNERKHNCTHARKRNMSGKVRARVESALRTVNWSILDFSSNIVSDIFKECNQKSLDKLRAVEKTSTGYSYCVHGCDGIWKTTTACIIDVARIVSVNSVAHHATYRYELSSISASTAYIDHAIRLLTHWGVIRRIDRGSYVWNFKCHT